MEETQDSYRIKIEVFEGPMDLLLHLIKKNEIDIYDIPISLITQQYIEYIELMKQLDLDIAGEFLIMASELTHIKSRMLLPKTEAEAEEEEGPDPRDELVQRLLEYQQFKDAAEQLRDRDILGRDVFARPPISPDWIEAPDDSLGSVTLFSLVDAFQKLLQKAPPGEVHFLVDRMSVRERIIQLMDKFRGKESVTFDELFEEKRTRHELVLTFLAILEMVRLSVLKFHQPEIHGKIRLFLTASMTDESSMEVIKDDYS